MKILEGTVISNKMINSAVVTVERRWRHPLYKKIVKKDKKYLAHDELGVEVGEKVRIQETRPMSKRKKWKIVERITVKKKTSQSKENKKLDVKMPKAKTKKPATKPRKKGKN